MFADALTTEPTSQRAGAIPASDRQSASASAASSKRSQLTKRPFLKR